VGFFHNEAKVERPRSSTPLKLRLKDIPVEAMAEMGCKVCPRDTTTKERDAKLSPSGFKDAVHAYFLFSGPSLEDGFPDPNSRDRVVDTAMRAVLDKIPKKSGFDFRVGGIIQCATGSADVGAAEQACCRNRVIADIEAAEPLVVVGVGDAPLAWATGFPAFAPTHRGSLTVVKIGRHTCFYYPLTFPNWAVKESKKGWGKSEHETILELDIERLMRILGSEGIGEDARDQYYDAKHVYDGVELITGKEPGDFQRLERALADMAGLPRVAFDIETSGLRPIQQRNPLVVTSSFGTFERTVAFAVDHPDGWASDVQRRKVWSLQGEFLLSSGTKEVHNLSMEMEWMSYYYGDRMLRLVEWDDTMSMANTLDERPGTKSLDDQIRKHFGFFLKSCTRVDVRQKNWWLKYPLKDILQYNGGDPKWTNRLSRHLRPFLDADPALAYQHARKVRLASTLVLTENRGLPVDMVYAKSIEARLEAEKVVAAKKLSTMPGVKTYERKYGTFDPASSDNVLVLMDKVYERDEINRKGKKTTDEEALSAMPAAEVPEAGPILELRGIEKLLSTYVRPLSTGRIISSDGRIHSKYSSMTAVTARLAGEDPNPQNWPKRKHKEVRGVVAADPGHWIVALDYGQIEFRVVGMASEDDNLVKYCWDPKSDVHKKWAERIVKRYGPIVDWIVREFGVDWDKSGIKTLRQEMKNKWVFPQLFGSTTRSCARNLSIPDDVADDLGAEFWDEFQTVKKWQGRIIKGFEKKGYVETLGGHRRRGAMSPNEAINAPIQGTAAEIVCEAMCALSERSLVEENHDIHPILNVHDDLTFHLPDATMEENIKIIVEEMCKHRFDWINVPLVVEASVGARWSELEELAVYRSNELFNQRSPYK